MLSKWSYRELPKPSAYIQWKGTSVCLDGYCVCGTHFHIDADFAYAVSCPNCKRRYEMSAVLEMREMPADEEWDGCPIIEGFA